MKMNQELNPILAARVRASTEQPTPDAAVANATGTDTPEATGRRKRIPMSVAKRKMEVEALPGYHLHWFAESNVAQAIDAGYHFVSSDEISLNQLGVGAKHNMTGNTDLGSRISIVGSLSGPSGGAERAYLMKLKQEYRNEDLAAMAEVAAAPLQAIFRDEMIAGPEGKVNERGELVYVKTALLNRPTRKAKIVR
jgi:hypothetical protein